MRRIAEIAAIITMLLLGCGCEKPHSVNVFSGNYNTKAKLCCGDFCDIYSIQKSSTALKLESVAGGLSFHYSDNGFKAALDNIEISLSEKASSRIPAKILAEILINSAGSEVTKDYNGVLSLHGTDSFGEWCLTVDKNGMPQKCEVSGIKLTATF